MSAVWDFADFDDHEHVHMFRDRASGLTAVIAVHSTHLGPGAGGVRYWHYPQRAAAITDALRLSRGMSYKNAMAGLPMGGGKGVILADEGAAKTPELLAAFGRAVDSLGGAYVTAEDVGITDADMVEIAKQTKHVSGLPVSSGADGKDHRPARRPLARRVRRTEVSRTKTVVARSTTGTARFGLAAGRES